MAVLRLPHEPLACAPTTAILRPWAAPDAPSLVAAWADPEISRWNVVPPQPDLVTAQRWLSRAGDRLDRVQSLDLVIVDEAAPSDSAVGEVGLAEIDVAASVASVSWWLLAEARGNGFAAAGVRRFAHWVHTELAIDLLVARCAPANEPSLQVARAAGFRFANLDRRGNQLWVSRTRSR